MIYTFRELKELFTFKERPSFQIQGCAKVDCMFYSKWKVYEEYPIAYKLPEEWRPEDFGEREPGLTVCVVCAHFKPFDLYRQITPEMVSKKWRKKCTQ